MFHRTLLLVVVVFLLGVGSALADNNPQVRPADATTAAAQPIAVESSPARDEAETLDALFEPIFLQGPYEDPDPTNACREAQRNSCNCNDDTDCEGRCSDGQDCYCAKYLLDCSGYPCVGSCRPRHSSAPGAEDAGIPEE